MENFLNNLQDKIIIIDTNGTVLFCNNSFIKFISMSLNSLQGLKIDYFMKNKSDLDKILREKNGKSIIHITSNKLKKKCKILYNYSKFNSTDAIFITLSELKKSPIDFFNKESAKMIETTEKLNAELKKRLEIEEELSFLLHTAIDITTTMTKDGRHKKISNSYTKVLGWTLEDLNSKSWKELVHPDDVDSIINIHKYKLYKNCDTYNTKCRMLCKNGEYKWLSWNCRIFKDGNVYLCTAKDITEEKKLEHQNKLIEEALHLENIKNEFFANISHEFKTPLNIILASLQIINNNINDNNLIVYNNFNLDNYLNSIKQNSYRLLRLANNIIDMTKIDTGYYEIHPKNHNIVSVIEDITMSVVQYIEDKGIEIIFDTDVEEKIISCDSEKIERIMLNLLSNAVKYVEKDGKIEVKITTLTNDILVSVKDNGVGISEDKIDLIFERFLQVDNTMTRKCEGSGIGLSIVESLVKLHGGNITVKSTKGEGTEFLFTLPIKVIENEPVVENMGSHFMKPIEKCNIEFSDIYVI